MVNWIVIIFWTSVIACNDHKPSPYCVECERRRLKLSNNASVIEPNSWYHSVRIVIRQPLAAVNILALPCFLMQTNTYLIEKAKQIITERSNWSVSSDRVLWFPNAANSTAASGIFTCGNITTSIRATTFLSTCLNIPEMGFPYLIHHARCISLSPTMMTFERHRGERSITSASWSAGRSSLVNASHLALSCRRHSLSY